MRARAERLAPDPVGILRDRTAFFRQGTSGTGAALLTPNPARADHRGTATLAAPDLLPWLHR